MFEKLFSVFLLFLAVILVPELCRKLGGTRGMNFHQVSSRSDCMGPSYDQKTVFLNLCFFLLLSYVICMFWALPGGFQVPGPVLKLGEP